MFMCIFVCICTCVYGYVSMYAYTCIYIYIYACMCVYIHAHIHMYGVEPDDSLVELSCKSQCCALQGGPFLFGVTLGVGAP